MGNKNSGPKVPQITLNLGAEPVSDGMHRITLYLTHSNDFYAEERKIFDKFAAALTKCPDLLNLLLNYTGCEEFIRAVRVFWGSQRFVNLIAMLAGAK